MFKTDIHGSVLRRSYVIRVCVHTQAHLFHFQYRYPNQLSRTPVPTRLPEITVMSEAPGSVITNFRTIISLLTITSLAMDSIPLTFKIISAKRAEKTLQTCR